MKKDPSNYKPRGIMLMAFMLTVLNLSAETAAVDVEKPFQLPDFVFHPVSYLFILVVALLSAVVIVLVKTVRTLSRIIEGAHVVEESEVKLNEFKAKDSVWLKFIRSMTRSVPLEKEEDVMLHHDYDGIKELDNQLPPWWKWGFYLTIVFAVFYLFGYHLSGKGKLQLQEYDEQMALAEIQKAEFIKTQADRVTATTVSFLEDPASIAEGRGIFEKNCVACHKADGGGNVGPNLTDDYWLHGGGIKNVFTVVTEGVPAKGMISWKSQLSPKQIQQVASYVLSLHGTNPPGAKEPQGDIWKDTAMDSDSASFQISDSTGLAVR